MQDTARTLLKQSALQEEDKKERNMRRRRQHIKTSYCKCTKPQNISHGNMLDFVLQHSLIHPLEDVSESRSSSSKDQRLLPEVRGQQLFNCRGSEVPL